MYYDDLPNPPPPWVSLAQYQSALGDISHAAEDSVANLSTAIDEFMALVALVGARPSEEAIKAAKEADKRAEDLFKFVENTLIPALRPTLS